MKVPAILVGALAVAGCASNYFGGGDPGYGPGYGPAQEPLGGSEQWSGQRADNASDFAGRLLDAQNAERGRLGLAPFAWDATLAAHARDYAREMAATRRFAHSAPATRPGEGENLWVGTQGAYSLEAMIGHFIDERRDFRPGVFADVSRSGDWSQMGHYTQIIWPTTRAVGCGLAQGGGQDWLVCRYGPAGNVVGQRVG